MITAQAINELNNTLVKFRNEHRNTAKTVGQVLESMTKEELVKLTGELLRNAHNIIQSKL